jgi:hypothetical protein
MTFARPDSVLTYEDAFGDLGDAVGAAVVTVEPARLAIADHQILGPDRAGGILIERKP